MAFKLDYFCLVFSVLFYITINYTTPHQTCDVNSPILFSIVIDSCKTVARQERNTWPKQIVTVVRYWCACLLNYETFAKIVSTSSVVWLAYYHEDFLIDVITVMLMMFCNRYVARASVHNMYALRWKVKETRWLVSREKQTIYLVRSNYSRKSVEMCVSVDVCVSFVCSRRLWN